MNAVRLGLAALCYLTVAILVALHLSSFTLWGPSVDFVFPLAVAVFPLGLLAQRAKRGARTWWAPYLALYLAFNFFYCLFALRFGVPEEHGGGYCFNNHGTIKPATALEYAWGKEHLLRMVTGHLAFIYLFLGDAFSGKCAEWPLKPTPPK